jgi:hypothetical protein
MIPFMSKNVRNPLLDSDSPTTPVVVSFLHKSLDSLIRLVLQQLLANTASTSKIGGLQRWSSPEFRALMVLSSQSLCTDYMDSLKAY